MGFDSRKKSGNIIGGSRLNVIGQGIYSVKGVPIRITKRLRPSPTVNGGNPPVPFVVLDCDIMYNIIYYTPKQFQEGEFFEFMDGAPYYFEN